MCDSCEPTRNVSIATAGRLIRPSRRDPTNTTAIQRQLLRAIVRRVNRLDRSVRNLIVNEDAFGLQNTSPLATNTRFAFETDAGKVQAFRDWLVEQINLGVLEVDPSNAAAPWLSQFVTNTYRRAATDAYIRSLPGIPQSSEFFAGGQAEFLRQSFNSPVVLDRIELLATRAFEQLRGITSQISSELNRIFSDGIAQGSNPRVIARTITDRIDTIARGRAVTLARTEIVHAYAEGSLDSFERLGIQEVGALVEWSTAGDDRVCPQCQPLDGVVFTIAQARGLIPLHPNCRCAWVPFLDNRENNRTRGRTNPNNRRRVAAIRRSRTAGATIS